MRYDRSEADPHQPADVARPARRVRGPSGCRSAWLGAPNSPSCFASMPHRNRSVSLDRHSVPRRPAPGRVGRCLPPPTTARPSAHVTGRVQTTSLAAPRMAGRGTDDSTEYPGPRVLYRRSPATSDSLTNIGPPLFGAQVGAAGTTINATRELAIGSRAHAERRLFRPGDCSDIDRWRARCQAFAETRSEQSGRSAEAVAHAIRMNEQGGVQAEHDCVQTLDLLPIGFLGGRRQGEPPIE